MQQLRGSETRAAALEKSLAELRAEAEAQVCACVVWLCVASSGKRGDVWTEGGEV